ncbi:hypothetical protein AMAG_06231 [Allomyces macrogynus ATCC 38327]|uniref:Uncharacterized protein n=1 Tax=Allomyces macrogynus (strain ATCC 38327) TaxID=578462 RepID=A0A0L0SFX2_ALLM3|nr:hypothetical protein AMAG_06231 [Allomyces macrogynus ATCC 38327]|eukprot:KNE61401.1 hypothetical protein AMAG_06231 [Allomyces macrogynus ATCC 38327]
MPRSSTDPPSMAGAPPRLLIDATRPHAVPSPSTASTPSPTPASAHASAPASSSAHRGSASGVGGPGAAGRATYTRTFRGVSGDVDSSTPSPTSPSTASAAVPPPPAPQPSPRRANQMTGSTGDTVGQPTYASMRRAQQNTYVSLSRNANAIGYMSLSRGAPAPVVVPSSNSANHGPVHTYMISPQPGVVTTLLPAVTTLSRPPVESGPPTLRERMAHGAQRHRMAIGAVLGLLVAGLLFLVMAVTMSISIPVAASSSVPVGVLVAALVKTVALRRRRGVGEFRPAGNVPVISRFSLDKFSAKSHSSLQSARDSSATTTGPDPSHTSGSAHGHGAHPLHINFSPIVTVDRITVTSAGGLTISTTSMPPTLSPGSSRAPSVSDVQRSDTQRSEPDPPEPRFPPPEVLATANPAAGPGPGPPLQETYTFKLSVPGGLAVTGGASALAAGMPSSLSIQISPASVTDLSTRPRSVPPSVAAADPGDPGPTPSARSASPPPPVASRTFTADPDPIDDAELHDATPPSLPPAVHHPRRHQIRRSASAALADAPAPSSSSRPPHAPHRHHEASPPQPRPVGLTKSESARVMPTARQPSPTDPLTASPRTSRKHHGHGHGSTKLALLRERVIEDIVQYKSHVDLDEASNDALPAVTGADTGSPPGPGGSRRLRTATSAAYMAARPAAGGEVAHGGGVGGGARMPRSASLAGMSASHRVSKADQWRPVGGVAAGSAGGRVGEVIREQAYYEASMEIQKWVTSTDHVLV